jgi:hypothetical protein
MRVSGRTLSLVVLGALVLLPATGKAAPEEDDLSRVINRELHADGPFFTASERALIERKCGYAPGRYDGFQANISNGVFTCGNGRRVDDPEMRAMLDIARPRIARRVNAVMRRPAIAAAIDRVAGAATARAMARLRARHGD